MPMTHKDLINLTLSLWNTSKSFNLCSKENDLSASALVIDKGQAIVRRHWMLRERILITYSKSFLQNYLEFVCNFCHN